MTLAEIKELIQAVVESGIEELELERGESRVRIRARSAAASTHELDLSGTMASAAAASASATNSSPAPTPAAETAAEDSSVVLVKAPIVGTFYESPSPGSAPFVRVGDFVQPGKVLCIIESMKLMNEIEAEVAGTVVSKLVENGHAVEYGEALFAVRPAA
jgi:acetyl-CoA carboxylase biotin carboxyl carrier protein